MVEGAVEEKPKKRILLLDDDLDLQTVLAVFLRENGYEVTPVSNGVDGVRELVKQEFDAVVCDMMMPSLPGDMFYLAVQRMRPKLCDRFLFVTGHKGNPKIQEFIKKVNGVILTKPFSVDQLLDMVGFVQIRAMLLAAA